MNFSFSLLSSFNDVDDGVVVVAKVIAAAAADDDDDDDTGRGNDDDDNSAFTCGKSADEGKIGSTAIVASKKASKSDMFSNDL